MKIYTCVSIFLATSNYRARGTCGSSTLNYSSNGAANAWEMEFSSPPSLNIRGRRIKFIIMQLIEISTLRKIKKLKHWSIGIFHFYWSEPVKEANFKESDWDNHIVSIQSSNGYLFHKVYFTIWKWLTIFVLCFETMLVWSWTDKSSLRYTSVTNV